MNLQISKIPIGAYSYYKKSDLYNFERLFKYLVDQKILVNKRLARISYISPSFYELYWAPWQKTTIYYPQKAGLRLNAFGIPHHAFHILCYNRFKHGMHGFPYTLALIEALCSSLDSYFELVKIERGFVKPVHPNLFIIRSNYMKLYPKRQDFSEVIAAMAEMPYITYKSAVLGMFGLIKFLFDNYDNFQNEEPQILKQLEKKFYEKHAFFYQSCDYSMFVLYLLAIGGRKSTVADRKIVSKIEGILNETNSLSELIDNLMKEDL